MNNLQTKYNTFPIILFFKGNRNEKQETNSTKFY